jgi:hypothetical protein
MCYHGYSLENLMLRTLAVLTIAGFAFMGAAQATPLKTESRQAVEPANEQVADAIIIQPRTRWQATETRAPKPRIWISMGFGF